MAPIRFCIPLHRKDLLRGGSSNQYVVENEYSIRELKTKLVVSFQIIRVMHPYLIQYFNQDIQVMVKQRGCQFVLEGGFDVIFSVLELFNKELPQELKVSAFEILADATNDLIRLVDTFIGGSKPM